MDPKYLEVDGVPMRWLEQGTGAPVIFVHGLPTCPALWRKVAERIGGLRLLMWEMVGYGSSIPEGRSRDITVRQQANYLRAWMRALGIRSALLVGHDLGGGVVQLAAVREPSICAGLVLTNSVAYDSWPSRGVKALKLARPLLARMPNVLLKANMRLFFYRGHNRLRVARESLELHFAHYAQHDGAHALARQLAALKTKDTRALKHELPRLKGQFPVQVVWGAADPFRKVEYGERLAKDLGAELWRIETGRHFIPEDHPEMLADAILRVAAEAQPIFELRDTTAP